MAPRGRLISAESARRGRTGITSTEKGGKLVLPFHDQVQQKQKITEKKIQMVSI